jgi:hypothetical protein
VVNPPPITLEALGLESWRQLYELDPAEVVEMIDRAPLHPGDAFLTVLQVSAARDTRAAVDALNAGTRKLEQATWYLVALGVASMAIALAALVVAIGNA